MRVRSPPAAPSPFAQPLVELRGIFCASQLFGLRMGIERRSDVPSSDGTARRCPVEDPAEPFGEAGPERGDWPSERRGRSPPAAPPHFAPSELRWGVSSPFASLELRWGFPPTSPNLWLSFGGCPHHLISRAMIHFTMYGRFFCACLCRISDFKRRVFNRMENTWTNGNFRSQ